MVSLSDLKVHLYADGADKEGMLELYKNPLIKGFTTNPSLMKAAGVTNYKEYSLELAKAIPDRSISFEVFADEFPEMKRQALDIKTWGDNVAVKIPVMNTKKESACPLIKELAEEGTTLNVTALFTPEQVRQVVENMTSAKGGIISVFAGRVADSGRDPIPLMKECKKIIQDINPNLELLWASTRETYNIFEADECGCEIITVPHGILGKLGTVGKDLEEYSLDTVKAFYKDATSAGFSL